MSTPWDARTYDRVSKPQQSWATDVLARLAGIAPDATVLDVGCGAGRVTEMLLELVPRGRVLAIDASSDMVELAAARLRGRARVWREDVLALALEEPVEAIFSTATLHWVIDHDRLWPTLARALAPAGRLEIQCGGEGNIARVREVIDEVTRELELAELDGFSPWTFAGPADTGRRLRDAGFLDVRCSLEDRATYTHDVGGFVRSSILAAHLERLPEDAREPFASAVVARVRPPLDYVRLNVSAVRA